MRQTIALTALAVAAFFSSAGRAEVFGWGGEVELGWVETSGNTEVSTIKFKTNAKHESEQWINSVVVEALNTSNASRTTAERYLLEGKAKYRLPQKHYGYGNGKYEDDRFSGYDYRLSATIGYGARIRETPRYWVDLEAGVGERRNKLAGNGRDDEFIARLFADFAWTANEYTTIGETLTVEAGSDTTLTKSETFLKSRIARRLALKAGFLVRHASNVPPDTAQTDRELTLTVVYDFK